ncbi:MAG: TPM domain-containing protein [Ignavibacteria bacterium]|nr:TPM domain-containing protein [Ignavibacteria bacterium]
MNNLKKFISNEDLTAIQNHIAEIEKQTSGEIRICFKMHRGWAEKKKTPKENAVKEFHKLGMQNTSLKTGILLYILFNDRMFEIVADEGINSKISGSKWEIIKSHLSGEFRNEKYKEGILKALDEMKEVLVKEFPPLDNDRNELSNDIVIE